MPELARVAPCAAERAALRAASTVSGAADEARSDPLGVRSAIDR
jgi:hypothetical protein